MARAHSPGREPGPFPKTLIPTHKEPDMKSTKTPTTPVVETHKLDALREHPLQHTYFPPLPEPELAALAADIQKNGLTHKPHVLPANRAGLPKMTTLDGHQRLRALRRNGVTETEVVVRYDLAEAPPEQVEREFLAANATRRQLPALDRARAVYRLFQLEKNRPDGRLSDRHRDEARDRIGKLLQMSGRNLARYFAVIQTPLPVQAAVRDGRLPLVLGSRVATLLTAEQERLAARIAAGECPKAVIREHFPATGRHKKTADAVVSFAAGLRKGTADLAGRADKASGRMVARFAADLTAARELIDTLLSLVPADADAA
jgi:ParB-like chromosome segregation protein Spo0J